MADVVFSSFAESDLENVFNYAAEFCVDSARKFIKELMEKFKLPAENPKLGRSQDNFIFNLRSFPYKTYTIFYFPTESGVEIYRVLHGARNIEDLFEDYFEGLRP
jgi:toxin ParE1/3/4